MPLDIVVRLDSIHRAYVDFNVALHHRGSDFNLYKNNYDGSNGDIFQASDTDFFRVLVTSLMSDDAGVTGIDVRNYSLLIHLSRAVSVEDLAARITAACKRANKVPNLRIMNFLD